MLKGESIVCFANDFRGDPTSKQQVMMLLSKSNKVLWVNSISMRAPSVSTSDISRIATKVKKFFVGLDKVNDNMYAFTPLVLPFPSSGFVRYLNTVLLAIYLRYYMRKLGMTNIQLWTFIPTMVEIVGKLKESKLIYYCVDEWSEFSFLDKAAMIDMETRLLKRADLVITTAEKLYNEKKKQNDNTHLIRHGVDFDFFAQSLAPSTQEPDDIKSLPRPRIGFFGLIHEWIDFNILAAMAARHPEWSIVLIGKVAPGKDRSVLEKYKNIHFLGQRDYRVLPGYCKGFDVGLIPFAVTPLTLNVNPIKLREYLAAGLPVVSTKLPEMLQYDQVVHLAESPEEFVLAAEKALCEKGDAWVKRRQAAVKGETWQARVDRIGELIENINGSC